MGMTIEELLKDKYKLRIPPTVYYDLLADVREVEEEQEPTTKNYLSEEDILELKHRYGDEVEFVVRDMISGEGKRWE